MTTKQILSYGFLLFALLVTVGLMFAPKAQAATLVERAVISDNSFANCSGSCSDGTPIATGVPEGIWMEFAGSGTVTIEVSDNFRSQMYCEYTGPIEAGWSFYPCNTGTPQSITSGGPPTPATIYVNFTSGVPVSMRFINNSNIYARMLVDSETPTPPATTEFNEVIDYIYEPVLNNSVGTSTVGATFSIPQPTFIDSIGVELRSPLGDILWTATSTADIAGLYNLSTEYYFDIAGAYLLQAYFLQDGDRIDNPVSLYITVNVPQWEFDPDTGNLVPVSTTTIATSTLDTFKVDCPDDVLVGSLCKLAVGLFVPKVSSIQGLQASFNLVMQKAPFSFFTQSKQVLDAFRTTSDSTGGTFSLTLYGESVDIVSTTSAAVVGIGSEQLDFVKFLMIVGLWVLFAWYLYWRIASIFGV